MSSARKLMTVLGLILALGAPALTFADTNWTAHGATGSLDESNIDPNDFTKSTGGLARLSTFTGTLIAYWTVENVDAPNTPTWDTLSLLNYDNSTSDTIRAYLYRMDRTTGNVNLVSYVSSTNSSSTKYDTATFTHSWDFDRYTYFIYAYISGSDTSAQPIIRALTVRD
ncbi:MAG: hypothetical protein ACE15D_10575 [Candidatus Eisenbacteria bacterium]